MWKGIANLIAKAALRNARRKRLGLPSNKQPYAVGEDYVPPPDLLKFLLPPTKSLGNYPMKAPPGGLTPAMLKSLKKHQMTPALRDIQANPVARTGAGKIRNIFRGETMFPDENLISKAGLHSKKTPGEWWSTNPWESADYAIRPSKVAGKTIIGKKIGMGEGITNPGVIRRISVNKDIRNLPEGWARGAEHTHIHPTTQAMDDSKISMFYSVVNRLRQMGWKDSQIFKYMRMIMKKKNKAGKRDWMLYNSGGIV